MLKDLLEIMARIEEIRNNDGKVILEDHSHKNYYSIIVTFTEANATFSDIAIIYTNEEFDKEDVLAQLSDITNQVVKLFNKTWVN